MGNIHVIIQEEGRGAALVVMIPVQSAFSAYHLMHQAGIITRCGVARLPVQYV